MTGPNDLIVALRQKRAEGETSSTGPEASYKSGSKESPMDMKEYWEKIQQMDRKIDRILEYLGQGSETSNKDGSNGTGNSDTGKY